MALSSCDRSIAEPANATPSTTHGGRHLAVPCGRSSTFVVVCIHSPYNQPVLLSAYSHSRSFTRLSSSMTLTGSSMSWRKTWTVSNRSSSPAIIAKSRWINLMTRIANRPLASRAACVCSSRLGGIADCSGWRHRHKPYVDTKNAKIFLEVLKLMQ
jgi:hypothetical protein